MPLVSRLRRGLRTLFARSRREADLEAEIAFHLEAATAKYRERGLSEKEARRAALLDFGGVDRAKEGMREAWTFARIAEIASSRPKDVCSPSWAAPSVSCSASPARGCSLASSGA